MIFIAASAGATDFAQGSQRDAWLAHPIYGEASFDAFTHRPGNPIVRGKAPHDWPVNAYLFESPCPATGTVTSAAVGAIIPPTSPCGARYRAQRIGAPRGGFRPVFPTLPHIFDGESSPEGHAPDVSVVCRDGRSPGVRLDDRELELGRYLQSCCHAKQRCGLCLGGQARRPFHRSAKPVATTRDQPALLGKYRRQYASTIIRRAEDSLVLTLTDSGPHFGWAYLGRTAKNPEGPWSEAVRALPSRRDTWHPPLLEFHPASPMRAIFTLRRHRWR